MLLLRLNLLWSCFALDLLLVATLTDKPPQIIILSPSQDEVFIADLNSGVADASLVVDFLNLPPKSTAEHGALVCCIKLKDGAQDCSNYAVMNAGEKINLNRLVPGLTHVIEVSLFSGPATPENLVTYEQRSFHVSHHPNTYAESGVEMSVFGTMANYRLERGRKLEREVGRGQDQSTSSVWQSAARVAESDKKETVNDSTLRSLYFDSVYKSRIWSAGGRTSGSDSGPGSSMENTVEIRRALLQVVRERHVTSILDIPCGDLHWMQHVAFPDHVQYVGADVSPSRIAKNQAEFPDRDFFVADLVEGEDDFSNLKLFFKGNLPDLVFVRHLFWHLPMEDNLHLLQRLATSGAKYVMLSTRLRADRNNATFVPVMGHPTNLFRAPYCLSDPLMMWKDGDVDTYMGLWKIGPKEPPLIGSSDNCMGSDSYKYQNYKNLQSI
jgi:SAM-dependent methyltransferase